MFRFGENTGGKRPLHLAARLMPRCGADAPRKSTRSEAEMTRAAALFLLLVLATLAWWQWRFGVGYIIRRVRGWRRNQ
jgi:hypothetical protein